MDALPPGNELTPSEPVDEATQVRMFTTYKIRELLEWLEPYVNGTMGDVSPRHVSNYLTGLKELNRLWRADRIPAPEPEPDPDEEAEKELELARRTRERVLAQLEALRGRGRAPGRRG